MIFKAQHADGIMLLPRNGCGELCPETPGSAGIDLRAADTATVEFGKITIVSTLCQTIMPQGFCALVCSRSGLAAKHGIMVVNAPGIIDSDFRDEVMVILTKVKNDGNPFEINVGDRIAQLVFIPVATSMNFNRPYREGGLGSTGS